MTATFNFDPFLNTCFREDSPDESLAEESQTTRHRNGDGHPATGATHVRAGNRDDRRD